MFKGFSIRRKKKSINNVSILEFPTNTEEEKKHFDAAYASPKLILTLKHIISPTAELECIADVKDPFERRGVTKAFKYINKIVEENLQSHPTLLK